MTRPKTIECQEKRHDECPGEIDPPDFGQHHIECQCACHDTRNFENPSMKRNREIDLAPEE